MTSARDEIITKAREFGWVVSEVHRTRSSGELVVASATLERKGSPEIQLTFNSSGGVSTASFIELDWKGNSKKPKDILTDKRAKVLARLPKPWTRFMDMHSGGDIKEGDYHYIYIQAAEDEAKVIFYNRFGHNPERVTCTCCGDDYSISTEQTLEQVTGFERGCENTDEGYIEVEAKKYKIHAYVDLTTYMTETKGVLFIPDADIKPDERIGSVPAQGYVWKD